MKTSLLFAILLMLLPMSYLHGQTSGGPDSYGYVWRNSTDTAGPVYNWVDIKSIGTQITTLADDNSDGPFNLNWNFRYYWNDVDRVWIGSNGWVAFQNLGNIAAMFPTIPNGTGAPNNYLAGMMCDLTFTQTNSQPVPGSSAWYWTNNTDSFIVQYDSVPYWVNTASGYAGRYTFQIILSGADSSITFQYKLAQSGTPAYNMAGEGLRTGIENNSGQIGLLVLDNTFPAAGTSVKFYYPDSVTYQVFDAAPAWNQNPANGGFFVSGPNGTPVTLRTDIANMGNQPIDSCIAFGEVLDAGMVQVYLSAFTTPALAAGQDTVMDYPLAFSGTPPGYYIFRTTTSLGSDMNAGNDTNDVELIVVDTSQLTVGLVYTDATTPMAEFSFGGNTGGGIYLEPPFYPATILSVDYYIVNGSGGGFTAQILDDDGPGNTPGTVLYNTITPYSTPGSFNNVAISPNINISSGGVYVDILMTPDTDITLGADVNPPFSYRNYEIIGGAWAAYRSNSTNDLMIRVNIAGGGPVSINKQAGKNFRVSQFFPNPAVNYTVMDINLAMQSDIYFRLENIFGQEIEKIAIGNLKPGFHSLKLNTALYQPGVYSCNVEAVDHKATRRLVIVR